MIKYPNIIKPVIYNAAVNVPSFLESYFIPFSSLLHANSAIYEYILD